MKKILFLGMLYVVFFSSCTKLDETAYDQQTASVFYATEQGANSSLASVYSAVRGDWNGIGYAGADRGWFDLNEVSTDECLIPIRNNGADWNDGGIWLQMYQHTFDKNHSFVNNTWTGLYKLVYNSNAAVELLSSSSASPSIIAEAKVARALCYFLLMDGWGSVPLYTDNKLSTDKIPQPSRDSVFKFIESELKSNVDLLPETIGGNFYGRFNKWAGYALLSRLYLNAEVYTGKPRYSDCIAACDKIINSGKFSLVGASNPNYATYATLFGDKCPNEEVILSIFVDAVLAPRNIIGIRSLSGPEGNARFGFGTWNGATAHKDFINKYDVNDIRKSQWEVGDVYVGGSKVCTYDLDIANVNNATTYEGARNIKFLPVAPYNTSSWSASNDIPIFRYAEILLNKAEVLVRSGNTSAALIPYNLVRTRAGLAPNTVPPTITEIYDERGREFCWEGLRRQDMIRFGYFLKPHDFKPLSPNNNSRLLFPIPAQAISANPLLKQNDGY